ncbi:unnamed protein product, partial [Heterosigma akashiwo]
PGAGLVRADLRGHGLCARPAHPAPRPQDEQRVPHRPERGEAGGLRHRAHPGEHPG